LIGGLNDTMRGPLTLLAICAVLYGLATGTRRLFLSDVVPIADADGPQSMWALDAAFLLRAIENIAILGFAAAIVIAVSLWVRKRGRSAF
jgi:hypothetical protein